MPFDLSPDFCNGSVTLAPAALCGRGGSVVIRREVKLLSHRTAIGAFVRLLTAAVLVAVVSVGAPLHSHDVAFGDDRAAPQKAQCAACITGATPGLVLDRTDLAPRFEAVAVVSVPETIALALSLPVRPGRAPPPV
jgi:hypothetical protein